MFEYALPQLCVLSLNYILHFKYFYIYMCYSSFTYNNYGLENVNIFSGRVAQSV
jgi:hypothetical protein